MSQTGSPGNEGTRVVPVFPLPNTVFFPRTTLSLAVFESHFRAMVRDVAAGEGMIVVSLASGDGFRHLGTLGRIRNLEPLEDGSFDVLLEGLERVSLAELPAETDYRQVQIESRAELPGSNDPSVIAEARLELLASYAILRQIMLGVGPVLPFQDIPFEVALNTICGDLPIDAASRQRLLDLGTLMDRHRLALEYISTVIETLTWLRPTGRYCGSAVN